MTPAMSFEVHPFILFAVVGALLALIAVVTACKARSGVFSALLIVLALVFIAPAGCELLGLHPELVDGRFRTYKAFFSDIREGMTREEVITLMEQRYSTNGPRKRPTIVDDTPTSLGFFMNPEGSRQPNCEGIFVALESNRVTKAVYSAD